MRVLLSAAGRDFLRASLLTFATLASGFWLAPNMNQALALAGAASVAAVVAGLGAIRVYVPGISRALAARLGIAGADAVVTGVTMTLGAGLSLLIDVLSAPSVSEGKAIALAGILGIGALVTRLVEGVLTPGETPKVTTGGIPTPPQVVAPESLPEPVAVDTTD